MQSIEFGLLTTGLIYSRAYAHKQEKEKEPAIEFGRLTTGLTYSKLYAHKQEKQKESVNRVWTSLHLGLHTVRYMHINRRSTNNRR